MRGRADAASARPNAKYTALAAGGPLPWDMIRAIPKIRRNVLGFLEATVARHGDLVAFPIPGPGVLLVNDPAGVRQVLVDNARAYTKQTIQYTSLSQVTGRGLLTSDAEVWRAHRRVIQPAFHHSRLPALVDASVSAAATLRETWRGAGVGAGEPVDADNAVMRAMLELVGHTLFAADLANVGERVVHVVDQALREVVATAQSPIPGWVPTLGRRRLHTAVQTLDDVCYDVLARRRAAGIHDEDDDLLALLLRSAGDGDGGSASSDVPRLTDREIRDELVTLVIAGHETVASSLVWTLHLLSTHPRIQRRLHDELDAVLVGGREPAWDDLPALTYTRAVVDEALRLFPPAWIITRRAAAADEICGVRVAEGTLVLLSPWLLHRRAESWPRPWQFLPDRFLDAGARGAARGDYVPFGAGPRLCIGRDAALVEATVVLASLLRDKAIDVPDGAPRKPPRVDALVTLRPRGGLPLVLRER